MRRTAAQKIADILVVLCAALVICNALLICVAPALAYFRFQDPDAMELGRLLNTFAYDFDDGMGNLLRIILLSTWQTQRSSVLAAFLLLAGCCTAVILVQGIRLLASVADGSPFSLKNAGCLRRIAICCFMISAGALGRTAFTVRTSGITGALSYTALFVPIFAMAGLLCLVMSALFRQAAELKAENDLTI